MTTHRKRFRVLLVCTGNTCRSPLAEAVMRDALGPDRERVEVRSAGTSAMEGEPASEGSRRVAAVDGFDLTSHRAHRLTREDVRDADLVLVMEPHHRAAVEALGADRGRVQVIDEWPAPGDPGSPVSDPFGGSPEAYEECWRRIRMHVERIVPHVRESLRAGSS